MLIFVMPINNCSVDFFFCRLNNKERAFVYGRQVYSNDNRRTIDHFFIRNVSGSHEAIETEQIYTGSFKQQQPDYLAHSTWFKLNNLFAYYISCSPKRNCEVDLSVWLSVYLSSICQTIKPACVLIFLGLLSYVVVVSVVVVSVVSVVVVVVVVVVV